MLLQFITHLFYATIGYGEIISRQPSGHFRKEKITLPDVTIDLTSQLVAYEIKHRLTFWPITKRYVIVVSGERINSDGEKEFIGAMEYPLFVTRYMGKTRFAHFLARRRFIHDVTESDSHN